LPGWLLAIALGLGAGPLRSQEKPKVAFQYAVQAGPGDQLIASCPSETEVKRSVETRMRYAPWDASADRRITVGVLQHDKRLRVQITLRDSEGAIIGRREIVSDESCKETMEAASLAIAIAPTEALNSPATPSPVPAPHRALDKVSGLARVEALT
jgi:hypothetical protein